MAPNFFSITWHGEDFPWVGVQGVEGLIPVDIYFPLGGRRIREGKKNKKVGKEGFPGARAVLLAV
jgi:hypothetical protein